VDFNQVLGASFRYLATSPLANTVTAVLICCSQRFYLLKILRDGGMSTGNFDVVISSFIVNRITFELFNSLQREHHRLHHLLTAKQGQY
jgi:hypothetical protein